MTKLIDQLRGGRERAASGHLALDREKAREKLRKFRLPDPHFYVLQFVRAAAVLGAKAISFDVGATGMECSFDAVVPEDVMQDLWGAAFGERRSTAQQAANYLALGIGSAQALRPKHIVVRSGSRELVVMDESERTREVAQSTAHTRITLSEKFRFGHLIEFLTPADSLAEARAVQQRCAQSRHLQVVVNGTIASRRESVVPEFSASVSGGEGWFLIDPVAPHTTLHLLKHGVGIGTRTVSIHGRPGRGAVDSADFPTDLSGLSVVGDHHVTRELVRDALGPYHAAVLHWLREVDSDPVTLVTALRELSAYIVAERSDDFTTPPQIRLQDDLPPGTHALFDWLIEQPLFPTVDRKRRIVPLHATFDQTVGSLGYARKRFEGLEPQEPPVVDITGALGDSDETHEELLLSTLRAVGRVLWLSVVDRSSSLLRQERRDINRRRWQARSVRSPAEWPAQVLFEVAEMTVVIYLPVGEEGVFQASARGLKLFHEGRLVMHVDEAESLPFGVEIDGSLAMSFEFDEVIRDERFIVVAEEVVRRLPDVFQVYAELIRGSEGTARASSARILNEWVCGVAEGTMPFHVLGMLGLDAEQTRAAIGRIEPMGFVYDEDARRTFVPLLYGMNLVAGADPDQVVALLGAIADVLHYTCIDLDGSYREVPLAEVITNASAYMKIAATGEYQDFLEAAGEIVDERPPVLAVSPAISGMLEIVAPTIRDAREVLSRDVKRAMFLRQPAYQLRENHDVEYRKSFETPNASIEVELKSWPKPGVEILFLHQKRLLGREFLDTYGGSFHVVVETDALDAGVDWYVLKQSRDYQLLIERVTSVTERARVAWWGDSRRDGPPRSGGMRTLYFEVAARFAEEGKRSAEPTLPAVRWKDGSWERRLISTVELLQVVDASGGVAPYCRTQTPDRALVPRDGVWVVVLGFGVSESLLGRIVPAARLADVSISATGESSQAKKRFERRDAAPFIVPGAGFVHRMTGSGFQSIFRMIPDPSAGHGEPRLRATVLYSGRKLEQLDVDIPMGRFRAVIRGESIEPGPSFDFVNQGRAEMLAELTRGAADTIRGVCEAFNDLLHGEVDSDLERLRADILRMMAEDDHAPPFDLADTLRGTSVFRTTAGEWLTAEQVGGLARGGWIPYASSGDRGDVLHVQKSQVDLHASLLPWQLRPADEMNLGSRPRESVRAGAYHSDPLLDSVVRQLVAARGDRFEIFDDSFARTIDWVDDGEGLCQVTADRIGIRSDHPLVRRVRDRTEETSIAFLASVVFSSVNRELAEIVDVQELDIQKKFLRSRRSPEGRS